MAQFTEWLVYASLEGFGGPAADLRAGTVASAVLLPHLAKGRKAPHPGSWFRSTRRLRTRAQEEAERVQREERAWLSWARHMGAKEEGT